MDNVTVHDDNTTPLSKYQHCPVGESRSIVAPSSESEKRTHATLYKSWVVSVPRRLFCLLFPNKKNRPVLDKTVPCGVQVLGEMKRCEARAFLPPQAAAAAASPPSRSTSASAGVEAPVKQEAEQGCAQAPPQRPLVPLVSTILKQQTQRGWGGERAQVRGLLGTECWFQRSSKMMGGGCRRGEGWSTQKRVRQKQAPVQWLYFHNSPASEWPFPCWASTLANAAFSSPTSILLSHIQTFILPRATSRAWSTPPPQPPTSRGRDSQVFREPTGLCAIRGGWG